MAQWPPPNYSKSQYDCNVFWGHFLAFYSFSRRDVTLFKSMWNTFSVYLFRSAKSATEGICLALHSVSHALQDIFD